MLLVGRDDRIEGLDGGLSTLIALDHATHGLANFQLRLFGRCALGNAPGLAQEFIQGGIRDFSAAEGAVHMDNDRA